MVELIVLPAFVSEYVAQDKMSVLFFCVSGANFFTVDLTYAILCTWCWVMSLPKPSYCYFLLHCGYVTVGPG